MKKIALALAFLSTLAPGLTETDLKKEFAELVTPMFSLGTPGTLHGVNGVELKYRAFPRKEGKGVVVLVPGYTESFLKYQELIYDIWSAGYSVYCMDNRGMGLSGRTLKNPQIVHVEDFSYYVQDQEKFISQIVSHDPLAGKLYVLGHSIGGLIAAHLMASHPALFRGAVLSAPMFDLATGNYPRKIAVAYANFLSFTGRSEEYAPGYGDLKMDEYTLATSLVTTSQVRFDIYKDLMAQLPILQQGGPSAWWVKLVLHQTTKKRIEALGGLMRTPILMLQPSIDGYVNPKGQNRFCGAARDCRKIFLEGSKHEPLRETDKYRGPALKAVLDFLDSH